jgi:hypothetical protein
MATGDANDMAARIRATLPGRWFPITGAGETSATPILDGVLAAPAAVWAILYALLQYVITQSRIATATGVWLDIISLDFFGSFLPRRMSEADNIFRTRIQRELFRQKGTRAAVIQTLTDLGCPSIKVFEPAYVYDTGAWDTNTLGWDVAGDWGETDLPYQFFVTVAPPIPISESAGADGWDGSLGGWDVGALEWTDPSQFGGLITNANIYAAIADVVPAGYIAWTQIT